VRHTGTTWFGGLVAAHGLAGQYTLTNSSENDFLTCDDSDYHFASEFSENNV
jgi:hypothetical protein